MDLASNLAPESPLFSDLDQHSIVKSKSMNYEITVCWCRTAHSLKEFARDGEASNELEHVAAVAKDIPISEIKDFVVVEER